MIRSEDIGKLVLTTTRKDISGVLFLIASKYMAQIKEISNVERDIDLFSTLDLEIKGRTDDSKLREFFFNKLEKELTEINEYLDFIWKKLNLEPSRMKGAQYEFHVKDLEDLIDHIDEFTKDIYQKLQENLNNKISTDRAIIESWEEMAIIETLVFLDFKKTYIDKFKFLNLSMVKINENNYSHFKDFLEKEKMFYHETKIAEKNHFFIIPYSLSDEEKVNQKFTLYNAKNFTIDEDLFQEDGTLDLDKVDNKREKLRQKKISLEQELKDLKSENEDKLVSINELFQNARKFLDYQEKMFFHKDIVVAEFWIQKKDWPSLKDEINRIYGERVKIHFEPVEKAARELENEDDQDEEKTPPTLLKTPRLLKPYKTILNLYGTPKYGEVNPLIFIFFSFPIFFGLMFGDVGQGICLIIAGIFVANYFQHREGWHNFGYIVSYSGIGSIFGGLLYGEFFGFDFEWNFLGIHFPIYHPFESPMTVFVLAIWVGTIQITLGLILRGYNYILIKQKYMVIADAVPKLGLLWSAWILLQKYGFDINTWLSGPAIYPLIFVIWMIFGAAVGKLFKLKYLKNESVLGLIGEHSMDAFETFLSFLSNAISYARIFAMTMVHLGFMLAVHLVSIQMGALFNSIVSTIVYIAGNAFVMILELLLVMIQNVRLHFYEFFSKFYTGGGSEFSPFKISDRFSKLYFDTSDNFIIKSTKTK